MLAQLSIPDIVDVGAGCTYLTQHLSTVVGVVVGGRLAFMAIRISLRDLNRTRFEAEHRELLEDADLANAYDLDDADDRRAAARAFYLKNRRRRRHRNNW